MRRFPAFDMPLLVAILLLVVIGIVCVYTASYPRAMADGSDFTFAKLQLQFAALGFVAMAVCMFFPLPVLRRNAMGIGVTATALLALVLFFGVELHGNVNTINLFGFRFQPSELMKVAITLVLASYLASNPRAIKTPRALIVPYLLFLIPLGIIVLQKDLGTASVFGLACLIILAIGGVKFRYWGVPLIVLLALGGVLVISSHRVERIDAWLNPFVDTAASYQPRNALIAIGSGGMTGRGFTESRQKWHYLPAAHNDYIFAIIAEEGGFLWTFVLIFAPYLYLVYRGFTIAHRAPDEFSALLAAGCTTMLVTQAVINMAVVTNLMPCMGINLPFISYGGTSLIASLMLAGLLLNVSRLRVRQAHPAQARITPARRGVEV